MMSDMAKTRVLLIDGHSMAYRAFFALPAENFTTAEGQHTNAIYGFTTMMISLLKEEKPTHVAVAFDVSRKTFRTEIFPEYKANRAKTPDEFRSQMGYLHELVEAFGIKQFEVEGFEADDIIATITKQAEKESAEILICTGDRDSFQLVSEHTTVLYPKRGVSELARMTPAAVQEKYGMTPRQYPDFAALRGDPSDNLPSIPGVGEKTAAKWIIEYGDLSNLLAKVDEIGGKVGDALRSHIDNVKRNRELTQLIHDAPVDSTIDSLSWGGVNISALNKLFDQLEFRSLKDRVKFFAQAEAEDIPAPVDNELSLFSETINTEKVSAKELASKLVAHQGAVAIACNIQEDALISYAVALSPHESYLVQGSELGEWARDAKIPKILHDAKALGRITELHGVTFDTELAAYLINPGVRAQEMRDLVERFGNGATIDESDTERALLTSACALFALRESLTAEISKRNLSHLYEELELPIAELLTEMEKRGVAVNRKALEDLLQFFEEEVNRETEVAHKAAGHEFNVASPKQLQVVLFDKLGLPKTKKIKTGYTTDADALTWLFEKTGHPVLAALLRIRETKKLATTIEGLLAEIALDKRIHTHFAQTVAATGRLSSVGPNLQNIPVRTEEGRKIRDCFIAGEGYDALLTADYSQIEMRIMAHLSDDKGLLQAFESGEDLHATIAAQVFGVKPVEVDPEMRRQIKAMSYGLAYGLSSYGLAVQLGLTPPEASDLMDRYFTRFGGIRDYLKTVVADARKVGYTETVMGRRRYLPDLNHDNRQRREIAERMALNAPIQGSAADIIKQAMLNVNQALKIGKFKSRLLLQVHDELILEIVNSEAEKITALVRSEMGSAYPLKAPLDVSVGIGKSWHEAAH
jgi:DNA polymerase-1